MYTEQELIGKLTPIFRRYPIKRAALFGSYARGEQTDKSDIDVLLEFNENADVVRVFYVFWDDLEELMQMKVDIITQGSLETAPNGFRERILNELRYIYEV